jgi:phosphonate transport system permease protein
MPNPTNRRLSAMVPHIANPPTGVRGTVATFEQTWRVINRVKWARTAIIGGVFLLAVAGSMWLSEVSISQFIEGLPGFVAYIQGTLPIIRVDYIATDIAEWYWGIGRWLSLLLDTLLMAFMGTLLGASSVYGRGFGNWGG